ncbi:MAG: CHAT domain-containing protein [Chitinophagaceae bacterium]
MPGKFLWYLPLLFLLGQHAKGGTGGPSPSLALYKKVDRLFNNDNPTNTTDSLALAGFEQLITQLKNNARTTGDDTILFQCYLKKGILLDVKSNNAGAKEAYMDAISFAERHNKIISDSLLFRPYVYAGTNYFNLNNFDSANYLLIRADALVKQYPNLPETERLYNTLGALHYVNGNYLQSKNYFNQALEFIKNRRPYDRMFAIGLQSNIASSFYKLGLYAEALGIYNQVIKEKIPTGYIYNGIYMNMGKAYSSLKQYQQALYCFKKISPNALPGVLNEMAIACIGLQRTDSATYYLDRFVATIRGNKQTNILDAGINDLYRTGLYADGKQYMLALKTLQHCIAIFAGNFNSEDIYANPKNFVGSYTYYRLFEALCKKAETFNFLNKQTPSDKYLTAALDTYNAAIALLSFIEKSYDTDDAKIFLKKKSHAIYGEALQICLQLHQRHPNAGYLQQAFAITEKNRASVMAANLQQKSATQLPGVDASYLQAERNIKFAIARLDIKSEQETNNAALKQIAKEKEKYEIDLSRLQKNLEQNDHYYKLKYREEESNPVSLQNLLNNDQALFSFYATDNSLHAFVFTKNDFKYARIDSLENLQQLIDAWVQQLQHATDGKKFVAGQLGQTLYTRLLKPMQSLAAGKHEWIIIPDGKLCLLPFESLPDGTSGKTILETTTVSYQFSSRFMQKSTAAGVIKNNKNEVLSFAPFVNAGAGYQQPVYSFIGQLPASGNEIEGLKGKSFLNNEATKLSFIQECDQFPIIHLATHAMASNNAASSFIAFYPQTKVPDENCLYLEEIYGLNMDNCKLVVISACETGKGELISDEGVISLGRAFAYAGCEATVNSLWKADDKATAYILEAFHQYLEKGYTKAKALQKAKIDYINSGAIHTSPDYWSNLVLTGNAAPLYKNKISFTVIAATSGICLLIMALLAMSRRRKKSRRFSQLPVWEQ